MERNLNGKTFILIYGLQIIENLKQVKILNLGTLKEYATLFGSYIYIRVLVVASAVSFVSIFVLVKRL
jgi:hypothetical protein